MCCDRLARARSQIRHRIGRAQLGGRLDVEPDRHVAGQRVVRRGLVGDEVERARRGAPAPARPRRRCRAARPRGRARRAAPRGRARARRRASRSPRRGSASRAAARSGTGSTSTQSIGRVQHRPGERLRAAHPAEPGGEDRPAGEVGGAEVLLGRRREGLVRALEDPLRADVDPAPGRHLAEHRQPERLEPAELVPGRPARDEHRVRDQHARRARDASGRRRPACRSGRAASRRRRGGAACRRSPAARRGSAPRARSRRRRRASSGCSATSGSRLFSSIRSGASVDHERAFSSVPRGARIARQVAAERLDRAPSATPSRSSLLRLPARSRCRQRHQL